jgi:hypothetical protein
MERNRLMAVEVDVINMILIAAGMNLWKLLRWAADFLGWGIFFFDFYLSKSKLLPS